MEKIKVAFICVHNSCRSQMAEAMSKIYAKDSFEAFSAGTQKVPKINQDAVKVMKEYDYDMSNHFSKLIEDIPNCPIVVTMGCNVSCPNIKSKYREDWGLEDQTGKDLEAFKETAKIIKDKVLNLKKKIDNNEIDLK